MSLLDPRQNSIGRIPLPNEVPPPPELGHLPASVLHTSTVEYLLSQNGDLMSRLSVNIRRVAELEGKFKTQEEELKLATEQGNFLSSELQVIRDQYRKTELNMSAARSEAQLLEKRLAEIYTSSTDYREALESENKQLRSDLLHLQNYRRRINTGVRPMVDRLKHLNDDLDAKNFRLEVEKETLRVQVSRFERYHSRIQRFIRPLLNKLAAQVKEFELRRLESEIKDGEIRNRLSAAYMQIQKNSHESRSEQNQLVEHYERRMSEARSEIETIQRDLIYYKKQTDDLGRQVELLVTTKTQSDNRAIEAERRTQVLEENFENERQQYMNQRLILSESNDRNAEDLKLVQSEFGNLKKALVHSEERAHTLESENRELRAQLSAMNAMWESSLEHLKVMQARELHIAAKVATGKRSEGRDTGAQLSRIENLLAELKATDGKLPKLAGENIENEITEAVTKAAEDQQEADKTAEAIEKKLNDVLVSERGDMAPLV